MTMQNLLHILKMLISLAGLFLLACPKGIYAVRPAACGVNMTWVESSQKCFVPQQMNDYSFILNIQWKTWQMAQEACQNLASSSPFNLDPSKGNLAAINTEEEQMSVEQAITTVMPAEDNRDDSAPKMYVWLGAKQDGVLWRWISGCPSCASRGDSKDSRKTMGQGCYSGYIYAWPFTQSNTLTPEMCMDSCAASGKKLAGIWNSIYCYCGDDYGSDFVMADTGEKCNLRCQPEGGTSSKLSSYCGGSSNFFIYEVEGLYSLWYSKEPILVGQNRNCGVLTKSYSAWKMADERCFEKNAYICELEASKCTGQGGYEIGAKTGLCYYIQTSNKFNWFDARLECKRLGGDLAVLASNISYEEVYDIVKRYYHDGLTDQQKSNVWIGLVAREWTWTSGELFSENYNNLEGLQPSKTGDSCLFMHVLHSRASERFKWADQKCDEKYPYVCQIEFSTMTTQPPTTESPTSTSVLSTETQTPNTTSALTTMGQNITQFNMSTPETTQPPTTTQQSTQQMTTTSTVVETTSTTVETTSTTVETTSSVLETTSTAAPDVATVANPDTSPPEPTTASPKSDAPATTAQNQNDATQAPEPVTVLIGASTDQESMNTFTIAMIVIICILLLAIIVAVILFIRFKQKDPHAKVQPKAYDARGDAVAPYGEEIYLPPPSETTSTSGLLFPVPPKSNQSNGGYYNSEKHRISVD